MHIILALTLMLIAAASVAQPVDSTVPPDASVVAQELLKRHEALQEQFTKNRRNTTMPTMDTETPPSTDTETKGQ